MLETKVNSIGSDFIIDPSTNEQIHISTVKLPFVTFNGAYETMIFGGKLNGCKKRYLTANQAKEGHKQAIASVYDSFKEQD